MVLHRKFKGKIKWWGGVQGPLYVRHEEDVRSPRHAKLRGKLDCCILLLGMSSAYIVPMNWWMCAY